jgi:ssDNA-binding Zn-finger/Zn-ribbon topoisomerase 1
VPTYTYYCPQCRYFEQQGSLEDYSVPCPQCGSEAKREPYSGVPYSKTETGGDFLPGKPMEK